jgi:NADH-quinone oxidoreductase subunit H
MTFFLVTSAIKVFIVFNLIMVGVALLTLLERRVCAWMQDRLGPNRVGPQGLLQPAADGLKNFLKEETSPRWRTRRSSHSPRSCRLSPRCSRSA